MIVAHKKFDREILFCNHARTAICFTPQNATAQSMIEPSMRSCVQHEIKHFFLTMWGDDGGECSRYATLPTLAYTASLAYGNSDMKEIKKFFHSAYCFEIHQCYWMYYYFFPFLIEQYSIIEYAKVFKSIFLLVDRQLLILSYYKVSINLIVQIFLQIYDISFHNICRHGIEGHRVGINLTL